MKIFPSLLLGAVLHGNAAFASPQGDEPKPFMADPLNGWKMACTDKAMAVMCTTDGGNSWTDESPPVLAAATNSQDATSFESITALCPLDARRAWLAVVLKNQVTLEYTSSGGRHWRESMGPVAMEGVAISFLDEQTGFILDSSGPAAGLMKKEVYGTQDGGRHWVPRASPDLEDTAYYTTGITFRSPQVGWVTGTYHGAPDTPLFHTTDGGKTWRLQLFDIPADYRGGYADTYPPVFIRADRKHGYLPVKLVRHEPKPGHSAWVNYETDDGGTTWHLPASAFQSTSDN